MKKVIFFLTLLLLAVKSFSQSQTFSKDYYLKKSKTQKTIGWVMLGGGVAMTTVGIVIKNKQSNDDPFNSLNNLDKIGKSVVLIGVGIGTALGSIPFFISSAKNARKAATISFNNQRVLFPQQNIFVLKSQPTLTLKIQL